MNDLIIKNNIYEVRGKQVMLDSDIAKLYGYETKNLNRVVTRNIEKFNDSCHFKLEEEEYKSLRCQNVTLKSGQGEHKKYMPYVFTKEGIQVLGDILRKENVREITNEIVNNFSEKNDLIIRNNSLQTVVNKEISINDLIYDVRGKLVMLDADLAIIYNCENGTKEINQAVRNNPDKFPERYCFRLTDEESRIFLVKNFDQKIEKRGGKYKNPRMFTEQGIYMLATILKGEVATKITIAIMDAFVAMKKYIATNNFSNRISNLETKTIEHDNKINLILDKLSSKEANNHIFYEGQIYDAYSLLINILNQSKREIIIIDNYASKELFDIIKDINKNITIITKNIDEILIKKYKKQYNNINIIKSDIFHDRFIIIDNEILYHSGASFKDLSNKCFGINKIIDKDILDRLLTEIRKEVKK